MNRALAAKYRKAREQSRAYAITMDMVVRSQPTTSKSFNRWVDTQVWIASNPRDVKHLRGRRRTAQDELVRYMKKEEVNNAAVQPLGKVSQLPLIPVGECRLYVWHADRWIAVEGSWSTTRYECMLEIAYRTMWEVTRYGLPCSPTEDGMSRPCSTSRARYMIREDRKSSTVTRYDRNEDNSMRW